MSEKSKTIPCRRYSDARKKNSTGKTETNGHNVKMTNNNKLKRTGKRNNGFAKNIIVIKVISTERLTMKKIIEQTREFNNAIKEEPNELENLTDQRDQTKNKTKLTEENVKGSQSEREKIKQKMPRRTDKGGTTTYAKNTRD